MSEKHNTYDSTIVRLKKHLINFPIGIVGTILGISILANIYANLGLPYSKIILMNLCAFILIIALFKLILYPKRVLEESKKPEIFSVYIAFPMTLMNIATFYVKYNLYLGRTLWYIGVALDVFIVVCFLYMNVLKNPKLESVSPSWFLLLVGSVIIPSTCLDMRFLYFARCVWMFSFIAYIIVLPIVIYRVIKIPLPKKIYPYLGITAAPVSLLIIGYLKVLTPNTQFLACMLMVAIFMTMFVYAKMYKALILEFQPSFAGLTFALSVSASCEFKVSSYFKSIHFDQIALILKSLAYLELLIATIVIFGISIMFLRQFYRILTDY